MKILVSSGFGYNTNQPFVQIESELLDRPIQMSPADARALALNLLQASEGAQTDAFLVEFMRTELKQEDKVIASVLSEFREYRIKNRE